MSPLTVSELTSALEDDQMVTLLFLESEKAYKVQRTLLTNASTWFAKALGESWVNAKAPVLRFPDTNLQVAKCFLYFLFYGAAPLTLNPECDDEAEERLDQLLAVRVWTFADKYFLYKLQNKAMMALIKYHGNLEPYLAMVTIREALGTSAPKSAMHRFIMNRLVSGLKRKDEPAYKPKDTECLDGIAGVAMELAEEIFAPRMTFKIADFLVYERGKAD